MTFWFSISIIKTLNHAGTFSQTEQRCIKRILMKISSFSFLFRPAGVECRLSAPHMGKVQRGLDEFQRRHSLSWRSDCDLAAPPYTAARHSDQDLGI